MYLATLSDGSIVVVGSSVRPVSGEEISGPFAALPKLKPAASSYWHQWLKPAADEYSAASGWDDQHARRHQLGNTGFANIMFLVAVVVFGLGTIAATLAYTTPPRPEVARW